MTGIQAMCDIARAKGMKIGFANGCFDLFHDGHKHLLKNARQYCDVLVVAINSDRSVRELKGEGRPVDNRAVRFKKLLDSKLADMIGSFDDERDLLAFIKEVKPDVMFKGADYHGVNIVGAGFVQGYGGKVKLINMLDGVSTTNELEKRRNT
jgi:D-beta-D-heptose 7-phosphate kinase/D-beta-D-heptose 1-phosphate adenosyltransferase